MTFRGIAVVSALLAGLSLTGCVAPTRTEDAAMIGARPTGAAATVKATAETPLPSLRGDILAGTSPEILARARAAQGEALTQALAKP